MYSNFELMKTFAFVLIAAALVSCNIIERKSKEPQEAKPVDVTVIEAKQAETNNRYTYIGKVEPSKNTSVYAQAVGTLARLNIRKGQQVRKGDVLAVIESEQAKAAYEIAKANLELAQDGYDRADEVRKSGSISEQKMVEIKSQLAKAQASGKAARKGLDNCQIKAPYDGIVNDVFVEEGVEVSMLSAVARILNINDVEITFPVPENEISGMSYGQEAEVYIPALDKVVHASMAVIGHMASPMSHTYDCTLVPNDAVGLLPGMVCRVTIISEGKTGVEIPIRSVMTDIAGRYVWVVNDGTVAKRYVTVDGYGTDGVIVSEGLEGGDKIVVEGRRKVSTGMKVKTTLK